MEQLFKAIEAKATDIATLVLFSALGFVIYVLFNEGGYKQRLQGAALGFFISLAFAYPIYMSIGGEKWWALAAMSSILTISGQFLPELFNIALRKFAKKYIKDKAGVNVDDH